MSNSSPKKGGKSHSKGKIRQNLTLSPETAEMLRIEAERLDTSMSALVTRWIREADEARKLYRETASRSVLPLESLPNIQKTKSSRSGRA